MTAIDWTSEATGAGAYADVNGVHLYYEIHGEGRPLVLLHGGLGSGEMFGPVIPALVAAGHRVIAPDLQGHGRTADVHRPIDPRLMADDIAALIGHLGLERTDVMGYSLGGGVALQVAVRHPALVRRLVLVSANVRSDAFYPEMRAQQGQLNGAAADFMKDTPMYQLYRQVAPRPEDFPRLLDKMGAWMANPFDFTEDVRSLTVPTLYVSGDADIFPAGFATAAGWARTGRRAATRSRSSRASSTTRSSRRRSSRPSRRRSSTHPRHRARPPRRHRGHDRRAVRSSG
jgi:pimeloyl-ACP methyl ester carboxylesterase